MASSNTSNRLAVDSLTAKEIACRAILDAVRKARQGDEEANNFVRTKRIERFINYFGLNIEAEYIRRKEGY